jgi:Uma2 family endonuclease
MATATETRYTPEDLLNLNRRPTPELIDGQLVEREPMGQEADEIAMELVSFLKPYSRDTLPGVVNGPEAGYQIFPRDPGRVRFPDVSFTRRDRLPGGKAARGYSRVVPDLVVEVVSPNDTYNDLDAKVRDFLDAGVPLIWVANPETRTILIHRADGTAARLGPGDTLDGEGILPGFRVEVAKVFAGL